jgi:uncharacterized protein (DUF1330 family)
MPKIRASFEDHPITIHASYGRQEVLEGPEVEGVIILTFPSFEEAKAWYDIPAYREARQHRFQGAEYRAVLVEGCDTTPMSQVLNAGNLGRVGPTYCGRFVGLILPRSKT